MKLVVAYKTVICFYILSIWLCQQEMSVQTSHDIARAIRELLAKNKQRQDSQLPPSEKYEYKQLESFPRDTVQQEKDSSEALRNRGVMKKHSKGPFKSAKPIPAVVELIDEEDDCIPQPEVQESQKREVSETFHLNSKISQIGPGSDEQVLDEHSRGRHEKAMLSKKSSKGERSKALNVKENQGLRAMQVTIELKQDFSFKLLSRPSTAQKSSSTVAPSKKTAKKLGKDENQKHSIPAETTILSRCTKKQGKIDVVKSDIPSQEGKIQLEGRQALKKTTKAMKNLQLVEMKVAVCLFEDEIPPGFKARPKQNSLPPPKKTKQIGKSQEATISEVSQKNTQLSKRNGQRVMDSQVSDNAEVEEVKPAGPLETGKASLLQLVQEMASQSLISSSLYQSFKEVHSSKDIQDFLLKFETGRLHQFDYQAIKFTLLDHRRMADILQFLFPSRYVVTEPVSREPGSGSFLRRLYGMSAQDYYALYIKIDKISGIKWWSKLLITNDAQLTERNKQKRRAERKAERAMQALDDELEMARKGPVKPPSNHVESSPRPHPPSHYFQIELQGQEGSERRNEKNSMLEQQKVRRQEREKEREEMGRIRVMVSNFSERHVNNENEVDMNRKRIKLY